MTDHNQDEHALDEDTFEQQRIAGLRCFQVWLADGSVERVFAHMHENHNAAGHLNFVTVDRNGIKTIRDSFSRLLWIRMKEIVDETPIELRRVH